MITCSLRYTIDPWQHRTAARSWARQLCDAGAAIFASVPGACIEVAWRSILTMADYTSPPTG
jgi:hypothetical protein